MRKLVASLVLLFFLAVSISAFAGNATLPPGNIGCCQFADQNGVPVCNDGFLPCPTPPPFGTFEGFTVGQSCNDVSGQCNSGARNVPALTEWGLILLAGVMGFIGYLLLRRKKATA